MAAAARSTAAGRSRHGFRYSSDTNDRWLDVDELREMAADVRAGRVTRRRSSPTAGRRSPTRTSTPSPRRCAAELITQGPLIDAFEEALAEYVGARHAVAFANGTAALHGAAFAAGLGPGDEVITTPLSFAGSSNCALYQGARPRFVDISTATRGTSTSTAAAAQVGDADARGHRRSSFAGLPVDLEPLAPVRDRVVVIEDACHALGGRRERQPVGGAGRRRHDDVLAPSGQGDDDRRGRRS